METLVIPSLAEVDSCSWNALAGTADPFLTHEFLAGLEAHGCLSGHGWEPAHVLVRDGAELLGALPLYARDNSYGEFVFDWSWAEAYERAGGHYYPKLVSAIPFTPVAGARLLLPPQPSRRAAVAKALIAGAIALAERRRLSSWHCLFPTSEQLGYFSRTDLLLREGCQYHWFNRGYASFDEFLATLNAKRRKEIKRERRTVAASGLTLEVLQGADITPRHWSIFYRYYCATFARKWGVPRLTESFLQRLNGALPDAPVLLLAREGQDYVAAAFALRGGDTLYGRHWGCSGYHRHLHFELCYYQTIEYCIREGLRHLDAGAQGEHKVPRGFEAVKTWSVHWIRDPAFRRAVAAFLARETVLVDQYIEGIAAHSAYRHNE